MHIEIFIKEKLTPLHNLWYGLWVYWWPAWRAVYSGPQIRKTWTKYQLLKSGQHVLDFGCGTGDFSIPAAKLVGKKGKVFALDCHPRQLRVVEKRAKNAGVTNIRTILSENQVSLPDDSVDVVWMCDVLHEIRDKRGVLSEANRILHKGGVLVVYDGMKEKVLEHTAGIFKLELQDGKLLKLVK